MKRMTILAAGLALLSPSCFGGPGAMYFRGVRPMNQNENREDNWVTVRIFQLKDDARFNQATVEKLWTDAKGALGEDLVAMKEAKVTPGAADDQASKVELGELPGDVRFIGILALYRKEDDKGPRKMALPKAESSNVLRFTGYHIEREK